MTVAREYVAAQQHEPWYLDGLRSGDMSAPRHTWKSPAEMDAENARRKEDRRKHRQLMGFLTARAARDRRDPASLRRTIESWPADMAELVAELNAPLARLADALERIAASLRLTVRDAVAEWQRLAAARCDERPETVPPAPAHALRLTATLHVAACAPNRSVPSSLAA